MKRILSLVAIGAVMLLFAGCGANNPKAVPAVTANPATTTDNNVAATVVAPVNSDASVKHLTLVSSESKAEFSLNEILRGVPTHVVGTSSQITGDVTVDISQPAKIEMGEIKLDAQSLVTDNPMRNKNIINLILKSNEPANQFIVFKTTKVTGVPAVLTPGQSFSVTIHGDLTISGTTKPVTFTGTVTWQANGTLAGSVTGSLTWANFGLTLPNFPFFSNVDKVARLQVDLVAR